MAKSRPKLVRKSPRSTAHPSPRAVPKHRAVVRSARRRTRPPSLAQAEAVNAGVPLRTLARTQVLASAESLGVTLSKPQLRKAIDRTVKTFKSRVEDGDAKIGVRGTVDESPSTAALGEVADHAGDDAHYRDLGRDLPFSRAVQREMEGIHSSLGPFAERGREHASLNAPQISRSASPAPSAWEASYATLDETVNRLGQRIYLLGSKLSPVLLPPHTPPGSGTDAGTTGPVLHVLEGVERQRQRLDALCSVVVDLVDRLVI